MVNASTDLKDEWRSEIPPCWSQEPAITMNSDREVRSWQVYWESLSDSQQLFREQSEEYVRNLDIMLRIDPRGPRPGLRLRFWTRGGDVVLEGRGTFPLGCVSEHAQPRRGLSLIGNQNLQFLDPSDQKDFAEPQPALDLISGQQRGSVYDT